MITEDASILGWPFSFGERFAAERGRQIAAWVATLTDEQREMLDDLLTEAKSAAAQQARIEENE